MLADERRAELNALIDNLNRDFGVSEMRRLSQLKLVKHQTPSYEYPKQRPTFLHMPGLTARPWWKRGQAKRIDDVIDFFTPHWRAIRDELVRARANATETSYPHITLPRVKGWSVLFLRQTGEPVEDNIRRFPFLAGLIDKCMRELPGSLQVWNEQFLSILTPGAHLTPHCGGINVCVTLHLALSIPEGDTALRVGDETSKWTEGDWLVFDDSFEHEAWNRTTQERVVLILTVNHPDLSAAEVKALEQSWPVMKRWFVEDHLKKRLDSPEGSAAGG